MGFRTREIGLAIFISIFFIAMAVYSYFERSDRFVLFLSLALIFIVFNIVGYLIGKTINKKEKLRSRREMFGLIGALIGIVLLVVFFLLFLITGNWILLALMAVSIYMIIWYSFNPRYKR